MILSYPNVNEPLRKGRTIESHKVALFEAQNIYFIFRMCNFCNNFCIIDISEEPGKHYYKIHQSCILSAHCLRYSYHFKLLLQFLKRGTMVEHVQFQEICSMCLCVSNFWCTHIRKDTQLYTAPIILVSNVKSSTKITYRQSRVKFCSEWFYWLKTVLIAERTL